MKIPPEQVTVKMAMEAPPCLYLGVTSRPIGYESISAIFLDYDKGIDFHYVHYLKTKKIPHILLETSPNHYNLIFPMLFGGTEIYNFIVQNAPPGYSLAYLGNSYRDYENGIEPTPLFVVRVSPKNGQNVRVHSGWEGPYEGPRRVWKELYETIIQLDNSAVISGYTDCIRYYGPVDFIEYTRTPRVDLGDIDVILTVRKKERKSITEIQRSNQKLTKRNELEKRIEGCSYYP